MLLPMAPYLVLIVAALAAPPSTLAQFTQAPDASRQAAPRAAAADLSPLLAEADATYLRRDDPAALAAHLWRLARIYFWLADDPNLKSEEKSKPGKVGWEYGGRATAANRGRVEGWRRA